MKTKTFRFLLVDDDLLIQKLYEMKFKKAGIQFYGLPNADGDFILKVSEINPDVILMDIDFKKQKNGVEASEDLSQNPKTKNIPIIFFSNADYADLAQKARKLPSTIGFLVKAECTPSEILPRIQDIYEKFLESKKIT